MLGLVYSCLVWWKIVRLGWAEDKLRECCDSDKNGRVTEGKGILAFRLGRLLSPIQRLIWIPITHMKN